jgi:hypothetical protein
MFTARARLYHLPELTGPVIVVTADLPEPVRVTSISDQRFSTET